ncbi:hypothetical protein FIU89_11255 [Roseovarius sp. THAF27]|uniref:hypothetical protein n=1 Tax=Roseovarius sp. THAF27 TaxID=2587850 RepID=UPI0012693A7C|nr:hypothetical protein [Roseovarius sp. THAF27]QFT81187.1 hypothetical protein FIU89_11255 [Roseovarius sp. THAF27]
MNRRVDRPRFFVVCCDDGSCPEDAIAALQGATGHEFGQKSGHGSGQMFRNGQNSEFWSEHKSGPVAVFDPHQVHREFPERWSRFIRSHYSDLRHVQDRFHVSERTARKWWKGESGAGGGYVAIAVNDHPLAAPRMLFAAE